MDNKKKSSNIYIYSTILIMILFATIYFFKGPKFGKLFTDVKHTATQPQQNSLNDDDEAFLDEMDELKAELASCLASKDALKPSSDKAAMTAAEKYKSLITDLLALNQAFTAQNDYDSSLATLNRKLSPYIKKWPELKSNLSALEEYNLNFIKNKIPNEKVILNLGQVGNFLSRWFTIEKNSPRNSKEVSEHEQAFHALGQLNILISSDEFLKNFIGS